MTKIKNLFSNIKELSLVKKIILCVVVVVFIGAIAGYLIFGNTGYKAKVTNGSDTLVSGDVSITKQNYFNYLLESYGVDSVVTDALNEIAESEIKDDDDDFVAEVESLTETYSSYSTDGLDDYAIESGYEDGDEFIEEYIKPMARLNVLSNKYIKDNLDDLLDEYNVCSFKLIITEKESQALKIISKATTEEKFDKYMEKDDYSDNAQDAGIVTKNNTSLDENLVDVLDKIAKNGDGIYSDAIKLSDDTYAVVYVYDSDHEDTDNYIDTLSSDSDIVEDIKATYLKKYNFKVYSKKLKKEIKSTYSKYLD